MMSSEAALIRKISIRLVPFLFLLYIVSYLDLVNVSFASLQMNKALGFSAEVCSLGQ
jgi:ACS family tartrate transporter-like MFS transporter